MNYYLTITTYCISMLEDEKEITQLVKASSKEDARIATYLSALNSLDKKEILEIQVMDTIIGE